MRFALLLLAFFPVLSHNNLWSFSMFYILKKSLTKTKLLIVVVLFGCGSFLEAKETKLLLVRHGQTLWNQENRIIGTTDQPLNQVGQSQAKEVAIKILDQYPNVTKVYSSHLKRAHLTADTIAGTLDLSIDLLPALSESSFGDLEGITVSDFKIKYREAIETFHRKYPTKEERRSHSLFPEVETLDDLENRVSKALLEICANHPDETVVVVSHSRAIRAFLSKIKQCDIDALTLPNCSISEVHFNPDDIENPFYIGNLSGYQMKNPH